MTVWSVVKSLHTYLVLVGNIAKTVQVTRHLDLYFFKKYKPPLLLNIHYIFNLKDMII